MAQAYKKLSGFKSIRQIESRTTFQKLAPFSKNDFFVFNVATGNLILDWL
jgi:hypothetical protein